MASPSRPLPRHDLIASLDGLYATCERLIKTGTPGNGRSFSVVPYQGCAGQGFIALSRPPLLERLGLLFRHTAGQDPEYPALAITIPPESRKFILSVRPGQTTVPPLVTYRCPDRIALDTAVAALEDHIFTWILEESVRRGPEPLPGLILSR